MRARLRQQATFGAFAAFCFALPAAGQPLSAIDWLNDPQNPENAAPQVLPENPPAVAPPEPDAISVETLSSPSQDAVGVLVPDQTGLPADIWAGSDVALLVRLIEQERIDTLPAARDLIVRVLLAEALPPETADASSEGALLLARVDKLLEMGDLDRASALLEQANLEDARIFQRWFDVSLLLGTETAACEQLRAAPSLVDDFGARIFCLARAGDWQAASISFDAARSLNLIGAAEAALLERFLSDGDAEDLPPPGLPAEMTPLTFRLFEALGEAVPTETLPRMYAHADLRPVNGWKAQLAAAERLAGAGVLQGSVLLDLYRARTPAASGGVWDRAAAIQALDAALSEPFEPEAVTEALSRAWGAMASAQLEVTFSRAYVPELLTLAPQLPKAARLTLWRMALLTRDYQTLAEVIATDACEEMTFLVALARADVQSQRANSRMESVVRAAFLTDELPGNLETLLRERKVGEAVLRATILLSEGAQGADEDVIDALRLVRRLGLEDTARSAALQLLLLERRG